MNKTDTTEKGSENLIVRDMKGSLSNQNGDGSLELAQMAIARLYDATRGAVTIPLMLSRAALDVSSFQSGTAQDVRAAIAESEQIVSELEPILHSIRQRRDQWLAHLDARTVRTRTLWLQKRS